MGERKTDYVELKQQSAEITLTGAPSSVGRLLAAASISAMAVALPGAMGTYGTRAWAQVLPAECLDQTGDNSADPGDDLICLAPAQGTAIGPVYTDVDDLTITIGAEGQSTPVTSTAQDRTAVKMYGNGPLTLTVLDSASTLTGEFDGVDLYLQGDTQAVGNDLTIRSASAIEGGERHGVYARTYGTGVVDIQVTSVVGAVDGMFIYAYEDATGLTVNATEYVRGGRNGMYVEHVGTGDLSITASNVTATGAHEDGYGIYAFAGEYTGSVTVNAREENGDYGDVVGTLEGIKIRHYGSGSVDLDAHNVSSSGLDGVLVQTGSATTGVDINTTGLVSGNTSGIDALHQGAGLLSITSNSVTGATLLGINAKTTFGGASTGLTIRAANAVRGETIGIYGEHYGTGDLLIEAHDVQGNTIDGIRG